jgi:hypothetical protein
MPSPEYRVEAGHWLLEDHRYLSAADFFHLSVGVFTTS